MHINIKSMQPFILVCQTYLDWAELMRCLMCCCQVWHRHHKCHRWHNTGLSLVTVTASDWSVAQVVEAGLRPEFYICTWPLMIWVILSLTCQPSYAIERSKHLLDVVDSRHNHWSSFYISEGRRKNFRWSCGPGREMYRVSQKKGSLTLESHRAP